MSNTALDIRGVKIWKGCLHRAGQESLVAELRQLAGQAPFRHYQTPGGRKMSVKMSGAGDVAWTADTKGYRYSPTQPDGKDWPEIPPALLSLWEETTGCAEHPDSCLINFYGKDAKMGLHQDRDEADLSWPVLSLSLGDEALFRIGNTTRSGKTESLWLQSGDVAILQGDGRLVYHGIDRIKFGSSTLLPQGGRINVTLRVAFAPQRSAR